MQVGTRIQSQPSEGLGLQRLQIGKPIGFGDSRPIRWFEGARSLGQANNEIQRLTPRTNQTKRIVFDANASGRATKPFKELNIPLTVVRVTYHPGECWAANALLSSWVHCNLLSRAHRSKRGDAQTLDLEALRVDLLSGGDGPKAGWASRCADARSEACLRETLDQLGPHAL